MIIYCDGGCRGNGTENPECYGSYKIDNGVPVLTEFPTLKTNNQAEYQSLITVLKMLLDKPNDQEVTIKIDSALVYYQLMGRWKIKNDALRELYRQAHTLFQETDNVALTLISGAEMKWVLGH